MLALLLLPLLAAIQSTLVPGWGWAERAKPELVLVVVLAWNLANPRASSLAWALVGGLSVDSLSGGPMGASVLALLSASALANFTSARVWDSHILLRIAVATSGSVTFYLIYLIVLTLSGWRTDWMSTLASIILPAVTLNTILMLLLFPPARWLADRIEPRTIGM